MFTDSRLSRWLRGLAVPVLALVAAVGLGGCGGGGHHDSVYGGTLEVVNDPASFEIIEVIEISQPFGPIEQYFVDLFPGETFEIDLFPDFYDVGAYWSDGFEEFFTVEIVDGLYTTVVLLN